jgi:hypothetical protein
MIDAASLITVCQLAISGGNKAIKEIAKKKLSTVEKELLVAGAEKGEFYILSADGVPSWVRVERRDFCDVDDAAITTKYLYAFKNLCERGYVEHDTGILFRLTDSGFAKARQLAKQI